jgi:hypothetical protein
MFNYKCKLKERMGFFYSFPSINGCLITNANSKKGMGFFCSFPSINGCLIINANSRKGWVSFVLFLP